MPGFDPAVFQTRSCFERLFPSRWCCLEGLVKLWEGWVELAQVSHLGWVSEGYTQPLPSISLVTRDVNTRLT